MSYQYQTERPKLFTDEGQIMFLKVRDEAKRLLNVAGAFREQEVLRSVSGESWLQCACLDRMIELGEIVELHRLSWRQYKVYTTSETDSR